MTCLFSQKTRRPSITIGNLTYIPLGVGAKRGYAVTDTKYSYLDRHNWHIDSEGYPQAYIRGRVSRRLHQTIMGKVPEGCVIDHINRNKLDNREANLRFVTRKVNAINNGKHFHNDQLSEKDKCIHGHLFTKANTYYRKDNGRRQCKKCSYLRRRKNRLQCIVDYCTNKPKYLTGLCYPHNLAVKSPSFLRVIDRSNDE